jgi:hypothetical protein
MRLHVLDMHVHVLDVCVQVLDMCVHVLDVHVRVRRIRRVCLDMSKLLDHARVYNLQVNTSRADTFRHEHLFVSVFKCVYM